MKNYGFKVYIKFSDVWLGEKRDATLRNVTEIHYNPDKYGAPQIAFESDIHQTGATYFINTINEFEATLKTKIEDKF